MQGGEVRHKAPPSFCGDMSVCVGYYHLATTSLSGLLSAMLWAENTDSYNAETEAQRDLAHSGELETRANAHPMPQGL